MRTVLLLSPNQTSHHPFRAVRNREGMETRCRFAQVEVTGQDGRDLPGSSLNCLLLRKRSSPTRPPTRLFASMTVFTVNSLRLFARGPQTGGEKKGYCTEGSTSTTSACEGLRCATFLASGWIPPCLPGISTALINPPAAKK